jgi:hypothetical protein
MISANSHLTPDRSHMMLSLDELQADVLILGTGGAGMLAAFHVTTAKPGARIVIAVKGLIGQSDCTRMVRGGYNCFYPAIFSFILGWSADRTDC